eukprot:CAMPEP_0113946190 /NCGR_PEP_ID=MMETSP1339-20121228/55359_1 /TAXON_ID=94617 /ORGANISM="Fibrocapsa japonica" /LENGTH=76 /DNA_ID=CAMNT_0000952159 /DNA_START=126 /DNA_END=353 /DNA_ORIENTATION=- /assembly_acc=CAM_ASM_000762
MHYNDGKEYQKKEGRKAKSMKSPDLPQALVKVAHQSVVPGLITIVLGSFIVVAYYSCSILKGKFDELQHLSNLLGW